MADLLPWLLFSIGLDHRFFAGRSGILSVSISEILSYAAAGFLLLQLSVGGKEWRAATVHRLRYVGLPFTCYVVLVTCVSLINYLVFKDTTSLHALKDAVPGLILYACVTIAVSTEERHRIVVSTLVLMVGTLGALACLQHVTGWPYVNPVDENAYFKHAAFSVELVKHPVVGTLGHPNALGVLLMPLLLLSLGMASGGRSPASRLKSSWGTLVGLSLGVGALVLTQAKMSIAIFGACTGLLIAVRGMRVTYKPWRGITALLGLAFLAGVTIWAIAVVGESLPAMVDLRTLGERMFLNYQAFDVVRETPRVLLLGGGLGLYSESSAVELGIHNEFIKHGIEFGAISALAYIILLGAGIAGNGRSGEWGSCIAVIGILLILLVEAASGSQLQSVVFLVLAMANLDSRSAKQMPP